MTKCVVCQQVSCTTHYAPDLVEPWHGKVNEMEQVEAQYVL